MLFLAENVQSQMNSAENHSSFQLKLRSFNFLKLGFNKDGSTKQFANLKFDFSSINNEFKPVKLSANAALLLKYDHAFTENLFTLKPILSSGKQTYILPNLIKFELEDQLMSMSIFNVDEERFERYSFSKATLEHFDKFEPNHIVQILGIDSAESSGVIEAGDGSKHSNVDCGDTLLISFAIYTSKLSGKMNHSVPSLVYGDILVYQVPFKKHHILVSEIKAEKTKDSKVTQKMMKASKMFPAVYGKNDRIYPLNIH